MTNSNKSNKKLALNKVTVRTLTNNEMVEVAGGRDRSNIATLCSLFPITNIDLYK